MGAEHAQVAIRLNNLARLLQATNRLGQAEPLMRRMVEILLDFTRATGHPHPHLQAAIGNDASLLRAMGKSGEEISRTLTDLGGRYGVDLGGAGGQAGNRFGWRLDVYSDWHHEAPVRTTIDINDALLKALRKEAAEKGKPLKTVVEETLQRGLSAGVAKKRPKIRIVPAPVGVKAPYRALRMNQLFDDIEMADPAPRP